MVQEILEQLVNAERALYDAFSYQPEWRAYPLDDKSDVPWILNRDKVLFFNPGTTVTAEMIEDGAHYSGDLHRPAHMQADGHSAFIIDTQTDGNKFFTVFRDSLRITDPVLVQVAEDYG